MLKWFFSQCIKNKGILRQGRAARVVFLYSGEEGSYIDDAEVTLFQNGVVHIRAAYEETTTHIQNCEIQWRIEVDADNQATGGKVFRLVKPRIDSDQPKQ
jgi:hypothetical protein